MGVKSSSEFTEKAAAKLKAVLKDDDKPEFKSFFKFVFTFHREGGAK